MQSLAADTIDFHIEEIAHRLRVGDTAYWEGWQVTRIPCSAPKTVRTFTRHAASMQSAHREYPARIGAQLAFTDADVQEAIGVYGARLAR